MSAHSRASTSTLERPILVRGIIAAGAGIMRQACSAKTPSWSIRPAGNRIDWPGASEELLGELQLADRDDPLAEVIAKEVIERATGRARCRTDASVGSQERKKQAASMIGGVLRDQAFFSCAGGCHGKISSEAPQNAIRLDIATKHTMYQFPVTTPYRIQVT
jgi:hypothetical protein